MFYTVYKVTNKINGKFYIGTHKTEDLDDGYMGSGKYLKRSQEKHGIENFEKEILYVYVNPDQMFAKEAEIVDNDFLAEENTYNLKVGGYGGFDHINNGSADHIERCKRANSVANHKENGKKSFAKLGVEHYKNMSARGKIIQREKYPNGTFGGQTHTEQTKNRMSKTHKERLKDPTKNSQFGTIWIYSTLEKKSKKIKRGELIPDGWCLGRKLKF